MKSYRIFVEKYPEFRVEAESLLRDLNANLNLSLDGLRLLNVYDLFGFSDELLEKSRYRVFGEVVTDAVTDSCDLGGNSFLAVECLPGQFDQRAASAVDCVRLIDPSAEVKIKSSKLLIFPSKLPKETMERIRRYYINAVESREKDLRVLDDLESAPVKPVPVLDGFREMEDAELDAYCKKNGLAMNADDLREVVEYFRREGRDPFETELRILDTYWSDHCRHTTFTTELENITVEESFVKDEIEGTLALYLKIRRELGREGKSICLMDLATIGARYLRSKGLIDDSLVFFAQEKLSTYKGQMQAGTYLLSTAYTPTRIMGILAGDEEQTGVTQDSATAADTAAQTDTQTTDAGTDTADTQSADGTADTQAADGTAGEGESGQ